MRVLRKAAIKAACVVTETGDRRLPFAGAIHVDPSTGLIRATNGSLLIQVAEPDPLDAGDFPSAGMPTWMDGDDPGNVSTTDIVIPVDVAQRVIKGMPKGGAIPILEGAAVGRLAAGGLAIASTDLTVPTVATIDGAQGDQLPDGARSVDRLTADGVSDPAEPDRPARCVRLTLSAVMLADLAKLAEIVGRPKGTNAIEIEIPIEGARVDAATGQIVGAVKVSTGRRDVQIVGAMMPCRQ